MPQGRRSDVLRLRVLPAAVFATVIVIAGGSSSVAGVTRTAKPLRWVLLFVLLGLALAALARAPRLARPAGIAWLAVGGMAAFAGIGLVSAAWSIDPRLSFARAVSFVVMVLAVVAAAAATGADRAARTRLLVAIVAAAAALATIGFLMAAAGAQDAWQAGAANGRFQGIGLNPNTMPMLYALALPIAVWFVLVLPSSRSRLAMLGAALLMLAAVVMSESRGADVAIGVGLAVVTVALLERRAYRLVALGAVVLLVAAGFGLRALRPGPPPTGRASLRPLPHLAASARPVTVTGTDGAKVSFPKPPPADHGLRLSYFRGVMPVGENGEIGYPLLLTPQSTLGSGRVDAWRGALDIVRVRPLLGYGFGTESESFVDRWYVFDGSVPENAFVGILLQLGGVGLVAFVLGVVAAIACAFRRGLDPGERRFAIAAIGGASAGIALMTAQSYPYSVGNVATLSFWLVLFLAVAAGSRSAPGFPEAARG